jgi:hypothetical protein
MHQMNQGKIINPVSKQIGGLFLLLRRMKSSPALANHFIGYLR